MGNKEQSKTVIEQLLREQKIISPKIGTASFFMQKSRESLQLAQRIFALSEDPQEQIHSYSWVVAIAYYAMFYAATALLAHYKHKINVEQGIHKLTYHALVYYFVLNDSSLRHHLLEEYKLLYSDAEELLQLSDLKVHELVESFNLEQEKRKIFTYELGKNAEKVKAITSLERAGSFVTEVRKIVPPQ